MKIVAIVGARPQFIKAAAVSRAIQRHNRNAPKTPIDEILVHTGQHYDPNMSGDFFRELAIPAPQHHLGVGSGPQGGQTAEMIAKLEPVLDRERADLVVVYGDTNSTLAGALAAVKLGQRVAHVEAGLRSGNKKMPEEINRIVADHVSSLLLCPTQTAVDNLKREGIAQGVHLAGDVMQDSLFWNLETARTSSQILDRMGLKPGKYVLATVHRAENTDDHARLARILGALDGIAATGETVLLPVHPRTRKAIADASMSAKHLTIVDPVGYRDMIWLENNAKMILTDSGGVQKESRWLGVPCAVLREETEWVEAIDGGENRLVGADPERIREAYARFSTRTRDASSVIAMPEKSAADLHVACLLAMEKS